MSTLSVKINIFNRFLVYLFFFGLAGCAGLDKLSVGQTDRLEKAPFYKSYQNISPDEGSAVFRSPFLFDLQSRQKILAPLAAAMNAYLDSLGWTIPVSDSTLPLKGAPFTYLGSSEGENAPPDAGMQRLPEEKYPPMVIHIHKPSADWKAALAGLFGNRDGYLLYLAIDVGEFPKADKGFLGKKVVLGTGYEEGVRFFSAEDKPVEVLLIKGMLLDRQGNILRAGGEGILFNDPSFWLQIFDIQEGVSDETITRLLRQTRRNDLPGKPLTWQVAVYNLVAQLMPRSIPPIR